MSKTRKYSYKDVDTMLASKIVAQNLSSNLEELSMARSNWTTEYLTTLTTKIDNAIDNYLGLDKKKELRDASSRLAQIQAPALRDLSFLKTQIDVDFSSEAKEIFKNLGYETNLRNIQKGDQEALIQMLYAFKKGMTDSLKTQITEKGTNPALINRIIDYANHLKDANVTQETLKETSKIISEEAVNIFNDIYDEIIGICKIASNFYQFESLKRELFTFSKIISNMGAAQKTSQQPEE